MKIIDLAKPNVPVVNPNDRLMDITGNFLIADAHGIPVVSEDGNIFGVITSSTLAEAQKAGDGQLAAFVWEVCVREFKSLHPDTSVTEAVVEIQKSKETFAIVAEGDRYIGLVTANSLLELISVVSEEDQSANATIDLED